MTKCAASILSRTQAKTSQRRSGTWKTTSSSSNLNYYHPNSPALLFKDVHKKYLIRFYPPFQENIPSMTLCSKDPAKTTQIPLLVSQTYPETAVTSPVHRPVPNNQPQDASYYGQLASHGTIAHTAAACDGRCSDDERRYSILATQPSLPN